MGNAVSFRLNPKNENDKKILDWLEEKSSRSGYLNQTEIIKKAILTAIEDEQKENLEKSIEDWISEAILLSREEFIKIVQESSQNVANNMFAGVLGAMTQQMNAGAAPMTYMPMAGTMNNEMSGNTPCAINSYHMAQRKASVNGSISVADEENRDNELAADTSVRMDNSTKSALGSLFDMDDD